MQNSVPATNYNEFNITFTLLKDYYRQLPISRIKLNYLALTDEYTYGEVETVAYQNPDRIIGILKELHRFKSYLSSPKKDTDDMMDKHDFMLTL